MLLPQISCCSHEAPFSSSYPMYFKFHIIPRIPTERQRKPTLALLFEQFDLNFTELKVTEIPISHIYPRFRESPAG